MGRYFGLCNLTKHHNVSHYWKNNPPDIDDLNMIAVIFAWDLKNDIIETYSYCDRYSYSNDQKDWIDLDDENNNYEKNNDVENSNDTYETIELGFNPSHDISVKQDIIKNIELYKKSFDPVFYCN